MAKPSGANRGTNKGAYKKYVQNDDYEHNVRNLSKSAGKSLKNVENHSSAASRPEDMPSKALANGKTMGRRWAE